MFLKVVKVDKFLKSSSKPFHNLMDEGSHKTCYKAGCFILYLLKCLRLPFGASTPYH